MSSNLISIAGRKRYHLPPQKSHSKTCIFHPVSCAQGKTSTFPLVINRAEPGLISIKPPTRVPINVTPGAILEGEDYGLKASINVAEISGGY
jgi:hypothetical protein